jgi:hypothetical protein
MELPPWEKSEIKRVSERANKILPLSLSLTPSLSIGKGSKKSGVGQMIVGREK